MGKKEKDPYMEHFQKLESEIVFGGAGEILRKHSEDFYAHVHESGLNYGELIFDLEEMEEETAKPVNLNQKELVAYFDNSRRLSKDILHSYLVEKESGGANHLLRKYFKAANRNLKMLLLYGLEFHPTSIKLLEDLAFFHQFENILRILITQYTFACLEQKDLTLFSQMVQNFYNATKADGYHAYFALREILAPECDKRKIVDFLLSEADDSLMANHRAVN